MLSPLVESTLEKFLHDPAFTACLVGQLANDMRVIGHLGDHADAVHGPGELAGDPHALAEHGSPAGSDDGGAYGGAPIAAGAGDVP